MTYLHQHNKTIQGDCFNPFGPLVWMGKLDQSIIDITNECIDKCKKDASLDLASRLAGRVNIQSSLQENIDPRVTDAIMEHVLEFSLAGGMSMSKEDMQIHGLWCNDQVKAEFNPIHSHDGMYSFVFYTKNTVTQESATSNKWDTTPMTDTDMGGNQALAGSIELHYGEPAFCNQHSMLHFPQEGDLLIFPAWLRHSVYPFYCEGERISVAGNVHQKLMMNER